MAGVARGGDMILTGHFCSATTVIDELVATGVSAKVFVNGKPIACVGDLTEEHSAFNPPNCAMHTAEINIGSTTVFAGGKGVARIGDSADLGSISSGSGNVNAGG